MLWVVLSTSVWCLFRVWGGLQFWNGIQQYAPWPGPAYVVVTGALGMVCGTAILVAFWRRERWADRALLLGALVYVGWLWLDRLFIQPRLPTSWPFSLVTNSIILVITAAVALDPRNRYYLGREAHEREEQDRETPEAPRGISPRRR